MSLTVQEVKTALLDAIKALNIAADVREYPLNHIRDEQFFKDLADFGQEAVLLVEKTYVLENGKRGFYFSAIFSFVDAAGEGLAKARSAAERFEQELVGADIAKAGLWIPPTAHGAIIGGDPQRALVEVAFEAWHELDQAVTE